MNGTTRFALLFAGLVSSGCGSPAPQTIEQTIEACAGTPAALTAPNPMYVWTPNAIRLVSQRMSDRVFVVYDSNSPSYSAAGKPLATSGGFVIGDSGVLLVESMINRQLFCQLAALVRRETDKPITHVINTSSHGDHSFGNTFLPPGVHVVQHRRTAEYIAAHFQEDVEFMKKNFGADQGLDEVRAVPADILVDDAAPYSVDLGGVQVTAQYYGFAQTGGDLFVHVPSAKVLWTGNPLVNDKPAVPWLLAGHGDEVGVTLQKVKAALPKDTAVVPGHGPPTSVSGFDFSVSYLGTLRSEVTSAVGRGLTVDQTVSTVTMDSFKGYAIWDWIHKTVNVPTTYSEIKK